VNIEVAQGWFERLLALTAGVAEAKSSMTGATKQAVISPDGTRLYVVGQTFDAEWDEQEGYWFQTTTPLNLQVLDLASGRVVDSLEQEAAEIKLTPDGNYLLLTQWGDRGPITNIVDARTLETINSLEFFDVYVTYQRDHQPAVVASRYTGANWNMAALDPQTFELGPSWPAGSVASWIPLH
jgi:hypothetical protein